MQCSALPSHDIVKTWRCIWSESSEMMVDSRGYAIQFPRAVIPHKNWVYTFICPRCSLLLFNTILIFWSGFSKVNPEFPYLLHFRFQVLYFFFFSQKHKSKGRTFLFIVVTKLCYSCFVHPVKLLLLFYSWARDISRPSTYFVQLEEYLGQQKVLENVYKMKVQQTSFTMPFAYSDPW